MSWGRALRAVVAGAGAVLLAVGVAAVPSTTAAWTDDVVVAPAAATGTWVTPAVPNPGNVVTAGPSTAVTGITWAIPSGPTATTCVDVTVTGTSSTPTTWSFSLNLAGPPFFGTPWWQLYSGGLGGFVVGSGPGSTAVISGVGTGTPWVASWSNRLLTDARSLTLRVCTSNPQTAGPGDASWYSVTQAVAGSWTATRACVDLTVAGNRNSTIWPFWFGWTAAVDLSAAKAHIVAAGRTVNYVGFSPDPGLGYNFSLNPTSTIPVANSYTLTSGSQLPVRGTGSRTVTACVYGF